MKCICNDCKKTSSQTTDKCFKDLWLFETFNDSQLEELKKIGLKKTITKGNSIFAQGRPANEMFLIKAGRIRLSKVQEDGAEITLDFRKAGDVVGENILSGEMDYPLSAWAMEETVTCGFNINSFNELILKHPDIGLSVIKSMGIKMVSMADRLESMTENSLESRLHSVLSLVAKEHGTKVADGFELNFSLTHEELGFLVGAHRVSITKAMKSLIDCGKILKNGKKITLIKSFS
ncbi:CRP/FNR family transcriptional regulator, anaerobic regulatory protein [Maridesulfovibrio ferrireducens]|uniref:CRP/FNR family transcriptional regulator, anaerobic regulatory protein n=1 Tax=Maridesulfovibrio ferrireducens TaxID=246191 RepID=A0A1G9JKM7_9BACT|nr:Crp/Fnr family transcriptional regulator [Maridesulfovibrio ferrireducens]SDL38147.1 CRP/FNR family transcriptional regulator, anaerobic regulatory protein [Maridesulfovibrio ferrireducens]